MEPQNAFFVFFSTAQTRTGILLSIFSTAQTRTGILLSI